MSIELKVYKKNGEESGEVLQLDSAIFESDPNDHVIYLDVKSYLAAQRQGTHKVKTREEVRGGGKKPYRQKGTGGARRGSSRSPLMSGGGSIFGPKPRNYDLKVNKKQKQLAKKSVLYYKAKDNEIILVEDFTFPEIKTKEFVKTLHDLKLSGIKTLFLTDNKIEVLYKSGRNIDKFKIMEVQNVSTYHLMDCSKLVFQKSAFLKFQDNLSKKG